MKKTFTKFKKKRQFLKACILMCRQTLIFCLFFKSFIARNIINLELI